MNEREQLPDSHASSHRLLHASLWLAMITLTPVSPVISLTSLMAWAIWSLRWRAIPYDFDVPPKSRYFRTLVRPPQHDVDPEDICASCRDEIESPLELPCGHIFCTSCVEGLRDHSHTRCPLCNRLQFTIVEPWTAQFLHMSLASTAVAFFVEFAAMLIDAFWPSEIPANPWDMVNYINFFETAGVGLFCAIWAHELGPRWIEAIPWPLVLPFLWFGYTAFFAGFGAIMLQLKFLDWSLLRFLDF